MNFDYSARTGAARQLLRFMDEHIHPKEARTRPKSTPTPKLASAGHR